MHPDDDLTFAPLFMPVVGQSGSLALEQVIECFPGQRIFSANAHTFLEWDAASGGWRAIPL
jgi:hypothetical protein